jgi:recombination protein RecA
MTTKKAGNINRVIQNVARLLAGPNGEGARSARPAYRTPANITTMSTGLPPLDKALGVGGLPYGQIVELIGSAVTPNSGGAISIATRIAAKAQRQQQVVTIIDMSHTFDSWQAERCGLIAPHLLLARPDTIFEALTSLENAARHADLVIVNMGLVAELLRQVEPGLLLNLLRRLRSIVKKAETAFLFVTAPYDNDPFNPANYPDGFPLAELAQIRLWVQEENWSHKNGLATAYKANLAVIKNELATPGKGAALRIKLDSF